VIAEDIHVTEIEAACVECGDRGLLLTA
jgi:hypothetical protein